MPLWNHHPVSSLARRKVHLHGASFGVCSWVNERERETYKKGCRVCGERVHHLHAKLTSKYFDIRVLWCRGARLTCHPVARLSSNLLARARFTEATPPYPIKLWARHRSQIVFQTTRENPKWKKFCSPGVPLLQIEEIYFTRSFNTHTRPIDDDDV
jgi:hypothetical protein